MAKGYDKHRQRQDDVNTFGRALARLAGSRCELCDDRGVALRPFEVPPLLDEADMDRTILICEPCLEGADGGRLDQSRWRFLEGAIWSELPPAQVTAVRILRRLADDEITWALAVADGLYLEPEIADWVDQ